MDDGTHVGGINSFSSKSPSYIKCVLKTSSQQTALRQLRSTSKGMRYNHTYQAPNTSEYRCSAVLADAGNEMPPSKRIFYCNCLSLKDSSFKILFWTRAMVENVVTELFSLFCVRNLYTKSERWAIPALFWLCWVWRALRHSLTTMLGKNRLQSDWTDSRVYSRQQLFKISHTGSDNPLQTDV